MHGLKIITPSFCHPTTGNKSHKEKFPATPPPNKKHSITGNNVGNPTAVLAQQQQQQKSEYPLTKSKSHECDMGNRIVQQSGVVLTQAAIDEAGPMTSTIYSTAINTVPQTATASTISSNSTILSTAQSIQGTITLSSFYP